MDAEGSEDLCAHVPAQDPRSAPFGPSLRARRRTRSSEPRQRAGRARSLGPHGIFASSAARGRAVPPLPRLPPGGCRGGQRRHTLTPVRLLAARPGGVRRRARTRSARADAGGALTVSLSQRRDRPPPAAARLSPAAARLSSSVRAGATPCPARRARRRGGRDLSPRCTHVARVAAPLPARSRVPALTGGPRGAGRHGGHRQPRAVNGVGGGPGGGAAEGAARAE